MGRRGSGLKCDGCDVPILLSEPELEVEMPDARTLRFHVACDGLWRVGAVAGAHGETLPHNPHCSIYFRSPSLARTLVPRT